MKKYILIICVILFMGGCTQEENKNKNLLLLKLSQLVIPITYQYLNHYYFFDIYRDDSTFMMFGYNQNRHEIDVIDLNAQQVSGKIVLAHEGENAVTNVSELRVIRSDSIVILSKTAPGVFYFVNDSGVVENKIAKSDDEYKLMTSGVTFMNAELYEFHLLDDRSAILPIFPFQSRKDAKYYETPVLATFDFDSKVTTPLGIYYPDRMQKKFYADLDNIGFFIDGNEVVYNFPCSDNVYKYDLKTGKLAVFGQGNYVPETEKGIMGDYGKRLKYDYSNKHYLPVQKLTDELYCRVVKGENEVGLEGQYLNREFQVLNKDFEVVKSVDLDENWLNSYFVSDSIVYFPCKSDVEDQLVFATIEVVSN